MSTVNVRPSRSAASSVHYALWGADPDHADELEAAGLTRAAAMSCSVDDPQAFVARAEALAHAHGREVQLYSYTQNFSPDEFDRDDPTDVRRVNELGVKLAGRLASADHLVVTHADSAGGHLHNHIYIVNHDNMTGRSLQRNTSWLHGLRQVNDELMRDEQCRVLPDPQRALPDWDMRRESFTPGGFEQTLGDRVAAALRDPRSTSREQFAEVLQEHDVTLAETERDGLSYKMRRLDTGKIGRRKASRLTPEFTAEEVDKTLEANRVREQQRQQPPATLTAAVDAPEQAAETAAPADQLPGLQQRLLAQRQAVKQPQPQRRRELLTTQLSGDHEVLAIIVGETADDKTLIAWQLANYDASAKNQVGLHLRGDATGRPMPARYTHKQVDVMRRMAGENRTVAAGPVAAGHEVLALRADLSQSAKYEHAHTVTPTGHSQAPGQIGPDVMTRQRQTEDHAREAQAQAQARKTRGDHDRDHDPAARRIREAQERHDRSRDTGPDLSW